MSERSERDGMADLAGNEALGASLRAMLRQLAEVNYWLDTDLGDAYRDNPLANDWRRITKVCEEAGEVWAALSAATGENPRKGVCGTRADMRNELGDVCTGALLAIQHETGDVAATWAVLVDAFARAHSRIGVVPEPKVTVTETQLADALGQLSFDGGFSDRELAALVFAQLSKLP